MPCSFTARRSTTKVSGPPSPSRESRGHSQKMRKSSWRRLGIGLGALPQLVEEGEVVEDDVLCGAEVDQAGDQALDHGPHLDLAERVLAEAGVNPNNGFGNLLGALDGLPDATRAAIEADLQAVYQTRPELAMVDSDKGITNLHVPSDVIVDASMPAMIRSSGQMWGPDGKLHDTRAMIPRKMHRTHRKRNG